MGRQFKDRAVTYGIPAAALVLLAGLGLREITRAQSAPDSFPLISVVRDFKSVHPDFAGGVADNLPQSAGNIAARLDADGLPMYSGAGTAVNATARDSLGRPIAPQAVTSAPVTNFTISGNTVVSSQATAAKITVVGSDMSSKAGAMPVTMRVRVGSSVYEPFGSFSDPVAGNVDDGRNPRSFIIPGMIQPGAAISVDGQSWTIASGSSRSASHMTANSSSGGRQIRTLRNGDTCPNVAGFGSQASAKVMLSTYIDSATNKIKLKSNQVIYLIELYTTNESNSTFDLQDLVVLVDLATDPTYFTSTTSTPIAGTCPQGADTPAVLGAASAGGITSATTFDSWFKNVPGQNAAQPLYLTMVRGADGIYTYAAPDFHPIDGELYGNQNAAHNRGFTLAIDAAATYKKCSGQFIEYAGDGDAWLFIDGRLAMDMGGTHQGGSQIVNLDRLNLIDGQTVSVKFFYAQRTTNFASFTLRTNTPLTTSSAVAPPGVSGLRD